MRLKKMCSVVFLFVVLLLGACSPEAPATPMPTAPPPAEDTPVPPSPEPTGEPGPEPDSAEAVMAAKQALAESMEVPVEEIEWVSAERREWPDACLGLAGEGEMCAQVVTPGWQIVLQAGGQEVVFRTDDTGEVVRPEEPEGMLGGGQPQVLAQGTFEGLGGHEAAGTATIVPGPEGGALLRFEDFSVTEGPDLYVYLVDAADPEVSADFGLYVDLGLLESNVGAQTYEIPPDVELDQYASVVIYCLAYEVLFARATLTPGS